MLLKNGNPMTLYHGTCSDFDMFRPLSHFGTKRAAETILKNMCNRIKIDSLLTDCKTWIHVNQIREKPNPHIIPVHLKIKNPLFLPDTTHCIDGYAQLWFKTMLERQLEVASIWDYAFEIAQKHSVSQENAYVALCQTANFTQQFRFIFKHPFECPITDVQKELALDTLYPVITVDKPYLSAERANRGNLVIQRMIRSFEKLGYDSYYYFNETQDFGQISYVTFRPEQVIRLDKPITFPEHKNTAEKEAKLKHIKTETMKQLSAAPIGVNKGLTFYLWDFEIDQHLTLEDPSPRNFWIEFALNQVMPEIAKITNQEKFGYHGLEHTEQVILFGIEYALAAGVRPLPVILACALHDCARKDDAYNETHGPACEPIAREFLKQQEYDLTNEEVEQIIFAIKNHTTGRQAPDGISACLWDADRTHLSWEEGFDEKYFTTPFAKKVAAFSAKEQAEYMCKQTDFLNKHKGLNTLLNTKNRIASQREYALKMKQRLEMLFHLHD